MSIGIGVIGVGMMGAQHAENLSTLQGVTVACVCDADETRAIEIAALVGAGTHATDPISVVQDNSVDAVVVASPDDTHADVVLAALAAGKPVLCEKPLGATAAECRKIVETEIDGGRKLITVGFMRRFDPSYVDLQKTLDETTNPDEVLMLHCIHRNATCPDWFTADMSLSNAIVHEVDVARWLLGEEIEAVQVMRSKRSPKNTFDDPQFIVMRTTSGTLVDVEIFMRGYYGYEVGMSVVCAEQVLALARPPLTAARKAGAERYPITENWRLRFARAYRDEMAAWVAGLADGCHVGASAWDGLRAAEVTDACIASKANGGEVAVADGPRPSFYD